MKRINLYPVGTWVAWTLVIPLVGLVLGIAVVSMTDIADLPFDNPELWWLGGAVPLASLLFLYGYERRRRALRRFASEELSPLLAARVRPARQALKSGLVVMAILMLVAAILGPRWGIYMEKQKVYGVDVVVAVDVSRSMLARDVEPNRLDHALLAIRRQLTERAVFQRAHRLALLAFAGSTSLKLPLTTDHLAFRDKLANINIFSAPRGGTTIAKTIQAAVDLFAKSPQDATKIILLFTDGEDHEGDPIAEAKQAYDAHGIRVFCVAVGDPTRTAGAEVPEAPGSRKPLLFDGQIVFSKLDVDGLRDIAEAGHGEYAAIRDLHVLVDAVSKMHRSALSTEERQRHRPRFQWFVALALMLLGIESLTAEYPTAKVDLPRRVWQMETQE